MIRMKTFENLSTTRGGFAPPLVVLRFSEVFLGFHPNHLGFHPGRLSTLCIYIYIYRHTVLYSETSPGVVLVVLVLVFVVLGGVF